jgi:signal transduction histidine kinase/CheY-like chemotaxis protein
MNGYALEVVGEAARRLKLPFRFERVDGSAQKNLLADRADIWPRLAPDEQDRAGLFFSEPWLGMSFGVLAQRGWKPHPGAKVAVAGSPFMARLLQTAVPGAEAVSLPGGPKLLEQVCSGQSEAALVETRVLYALLLNDRDRQCDGVQLETTPARGLAVLPSAIAARPAAAWAARMLREEIGRMAADGGLSSIHAKWFSITSVETLAIDNLRNAERDLFTLRAVAAVFAGLVLTLAYMFRRLRELRRQAVSACDVRTRFVGNVSHELRSPLSGIVGLAEMLSDTRLTAHQSDLLRLVRSTAQSLLQVTNDLLNLSRVEAGKLEIESVPFDLRATVEEVCAMMAGRAAEKGIRLEAALPPGLPKQVIGDPNRLREVLMNLFGNGLRFTEKGEVRLSVAAEKTTAFQWQIAFTLADTGVGIPAADLPHLFRDFEDDMTDREPVRRGAGLSLAIGKRLVELMGGSIGVESPGGVGARFRFVLPFDVASERGQQELPDQPGVQARTRPLRVLLCEDDPVSRRVAEHLLGKLSHEVLAVVNGAEAVEAAARERFDLILMDCQLPDIDGYEAARRIRSGGGASAGAPVVALTASVLASDRARCVAAGMGGFLAKPLSLAALSEALAGFEPAAANQESRAESLPSLDDVY